MSKLLITTQVYENYGAHDWDGVGECPQYWKAKGGNDYVVKNINLNKATGIRYFCGGCGGANTPVSGCPNQTCTDQRETCHKCFGQGGALALF